MGLPSQTALYNFYNIAGEKSYYEVNDPKISETLLVINMVLTSEQTIVTRAIYDIMALIGDIGGVQPLLVSLAGIFLYSCGE